MKLVETLYDSLYICYYYCKLDIDRNIRDFVSQLRFVFFLSLQGQWLGLLARTSMGGLVDNRADFTYCCFQPKRSGQIHNTIYRGKFCLSDRTDIYHRGFQGSR